MQQANGTARLPEVSGVSRESKGGSNGHRAPCDAQVLHFAGVGDVHGRMCEMVERIETWCAANGTAVSFVLQAGDFEPHRNEDDLSTMAAPSKYKHLGDFPRFASGAARFPWPVHFVGGNHEPYGYLELHPTGARIAENCHYLGRGGMTTLGGLRVAYLSGVYSEARYHSKRPGAEARQRVSNKAYAAFTEGDLERILACAEGQPATGARAAQRTQRFADILLLHEWPEGIVAEADRSRIEAQCRRLRYARLGNEPARLLLELLRPQMVLCAHMHLRYETTLVLPGGPHVRVCGLGRIDDGDDGLAMFRTTGDARIHQLVAA